MSFLSRCTADTLASAAHSLREGSLVAFPTETVYGLGADATNQNAVARIYKVKGRPADHPLIVHIASINVMPEWAVEIPEYAIALARRFWPGPMTLVVKRSALAKDFITGGQQTVGLRVPKQPIALALLEEFAKVGGKGIAAPSANRFGAVSPTTAQAVEEEIGTYILESDLILDGGPCDVGVESTIIDCTHTNPRILRPGAITVEMINECTGLSVEDPAGDQIRVSGSLESHYSPKARVILDQEPQPGDGFIALANVETPPETIRLASPENLDEYARGLYSALRKADQLALRRVVVLLPPPEGIGIALIDRLRRSATLG
jgi:L-threonylcarbamoyladenylate synthase